MKKYTQTILMSLRAQTNGGVLYLLPNILVQVIYLLPLMFLWSVLASQGVEVGMSLEQMLTYTFINALLAEMMVVKTFASAWNYEGKLPMLFSRPMSVFGQIIGQTVGAWIPMLLMFSLPMLLLSPLLGINVIPQSPWFFVSLFFCISLGFAIDFIFVCVTIRLGGMAWLAYSMRMAIVSLLSGTLIPFRILPFNLEAVFKYQPFGSLGGAPLSVFVGTAAPAETIVVQIFWNIVFWAWAILWFKKSQERMVSFGG